MFRTLRLHFRLSPTKGDDPKLTLEEVLQGGWDEEDQEGVGHPLLDHRSALDIDLEDHVVTGEEGVPDGAARRSVPVAVDLVGLQELAAVAEARELVQAEEPVVDPVDLVGPPGTRGAGHHVFEIRDARLGAEGLDDAVLADPGRSRDDDEHSARCPERVPLGGPRLPPRTLPRRGVVGHAEAPRSRSRRASRSGGSGAVARMRSPREGDVSSSRQAWRKRRSRPSGPRDEVPVP